MVERARRTRLDTEEVAKPPRPKIPELSEFAVLRELLALVVEAAEEDAELVVAPVALRRATAAKVSRRETALGSSPWVEGSPGWREKSGQPGSESGWGSWVSGVREGRTMEVQKP